MRVLVFGDSIAQGFWCENGGWVELLRMHYWRKYFTGEHKDPPSVFNLAVSGNTSADVLERFYDEASARVLDDIALVFAVGVNDSRLHGSEPVSNVEAYVANLRAILRQAEQLTDRIVFVGCTTVDEALTQPVSWGNTAYNNACIWEYETVLRKFCSENNLVHIPIYENYQTHDDLFADGLHPNTKGHQIIFDAVLPVIDKAIQ